MGFPMNFDIYNYACDKADSNRQSINKAKSEQRYWVYEQITI